MLHGGFEVIAPFLSATLYAAFTITVALSPWPTTFTMTNTLRNSSNKTRRMQRRSTSLSASTLSIPRGASLRPILVAQVVEVRLRFCTLLHYTNQIQGEVRCAETQYKLPAKHHPPDRQSQCSAAGKGGRRVKIPAQGYESRTYTSREGR